MVLINKKEKELISKRYPNINYVRTMKQDSKRHRYYMEEASGAMRMLRKLRHCETEEDRRYEYNKRMSRRQNNWQPRQQG